MPDRPHRASSGVSFYAGVFLIAAVVIAMQIMQSRIFSVTTWYHLSFLVISVAMFGMTLGALVVHRRDECKQRENCEELAAKAALKCGIALVAALPFHLRFPIIGSDFSTTLFTLPLVAAVTCLAYYHGGGALSLCLTRSSRPVARVYGTDLLGAAAGCLLALLLMETLDTPTGIVLIGGVAAASSFLFAAGSLAPNRRRQALALAGLCLLAAAANTVISPAPLRPAPRKLRWNVPNVGVIQTEAWNSISRVIVFEELAGVAPFLWGPSPLLAEQGFKSTRSDLAIDGDAGTPITKFDGQDWESLRYLEYDVTNLAYALPGLRSAAIIGIGGGRDSLAAKYFGLETVKAMDVNRIQIELLRDDAKFGRYANINRLPGVELIHAEARSWFRENREKLDLVQMSLIDTWAATGAGAFALSENGLYTVEAWSTFWNDLAPGGAFTVSRWASEAEAFRMVSLATATLLKHNVPDPRRHLYLARGQSVVTLILSKDPLSDPQLAALDQRVADMQFEIFFSPSRPENHPTADLLLSAKSIADLSQDIPALPLFDVSPPTDMRPFFFNQAKFSRPWGIVSLAFEGGDLGTFYGHAKASFNLLLIIAFAALTVLAAIVWPLRNVAKGINRKLVIPGTGYFFLIGVGFMLLEISLLQGLGVFLGHPIYGLSVVLFSLILSTGLGSLLCDRRPLRTKNETTAWALAVFAYALALAFFLDDFFVWLSDTALWDRAAASCLIVLPLGILLGYGFPTGMRLTERVDTRSTAWFWGINGAAGVLSSALAIAASIAFGVDWTLLLGGVCYALLVPLVIAFPESPASGEANGTVVQPHTA